MNMSVCPLARLLGVQFPLPLVDLLQERSRPTLTLKP